MTGFRVLFVHALRERVANTNRLLLAGAIFLLLPVIRFFESGAGDLPGSATAMWLALAFGAGLIGPDAAGGVLQLVLARPVSRFHYILARWTAAAGLAGGAALVQTLLIAAVMTSRGGAPTLSALGWALVHQSSTGLGITAVLAAFSAIMAGYGDIRAWILGLLLGQVIELGGQARHWPWVARAGDEVQKVMLASLAVEPSLGWSPATGYAVVQWASTLAVALAVATAALNRKELSYGGS